MLNDNEGECSIRVSKVIINGKEYLRTEEGVILDKNNYEVLDIVYDE